MTLMISDLYINILDSLSDHISVIDSQGGIFYVNESWNNFSCKNTGGDVVNWIGANYLTACKESAEHGDGFGARAYEGISAVINQEKKHFYMEYPCHSPTVKRWFMMRATVMEGSELFIVISHQDITERKLIEEQVLKMSRTDPLTSLANRREFDSFLAQEWRRCCRDEHGIALLIIDLDFFKKLNDSLGHLAGDQCLREVGQILLSVASRSNELCARYGGEEFAVVIGGGSLQEAEKMAERIHQSLQKRGLPHPGSEIGRVSASIGISHIVPPRGEEEDILIGRADSALYQAKRNGRNRSENSL